MQNNYKVVIIGHSFTSRLSIIRSIGPMGWDVTVIVMTGYRRFGKGLDTTKPIDCYSRYVNHVYYCHKKDEKSLVSLLQKKCTDPLQKVVIIPDSDFSAAVIDKNQDQLKGSFLFPHINYNQGAVVKWMDKMKQKELAKKVGLNVSASCVVCINNSKYTIPNSINYPCFTKPLATIVGGKELLQRCQNENELRTILDRAKCLSDNIQVLVEDYKEIEVEYAVLGFSNNNEVVIPGIIEITQMSQSHFGVARQGKVLPINGFERLIELYKSFIKKIGFIGLFDIDFYKCDGLIYFGELNLRFGGSGYAISKMDVNLPVMLVKALNGCDIKGMRSLVEQKAVFVNERLCIDDWYHGFITIGQYSYMICNSDICFVYDDNDSEPQKILERRLQIRRVKKELKRMLSIVCPQYKSLSKKTISRNY